MAPRDSTTQSINKMRQTWLGYKVYSLNKRRKEKCFAARFLDVHWFCILAGWGTYCLRRTVKISSMHVLLFSQSTAIHCYQDVKTFPWKAPRWPKLLQQGCWWELRVIVCLLYWLPMTPRIESEILCLTSTAFWGQTPSLSPKTTLLSDSCFTCGSFSLQKYGRPFAIRHICFRAVPCPGTEGWQPLHL